jgi:hypothetical protein
MGIGDEIMAAGEATMHRQRTGKPTAIVDSHGRLRKHPIWENNADVATSFKHAGARLFNCPGFRPYVAAKNEERWTWKPYHPKPARIVLYAAEEEFGRKHAGKILIEPNIKQIGHTNKAWLPERWQQLADRFPGRFVQVGWGDFRRLDGVEIAVTHTPRLAAAVLKHSLAYVGPEGGLHHMAAALERPAVVLFGGFISPENTGYDTHRNLFTGGRACGMRRNCEHCRKAMSAITVDIVARHIEEILNDSSRRLELSGWRAPPARMDARP